MTIYGVGYRALSYTPEPVWRRLLPIALMELRALFRSRWGVALFLLCLVPSLVSLFVMLVTMGVLKIGRQVGEQLGQSGRLPREFGTQIARMLPDRAEFYVEPIVTESLAVFMILTALVGCRAIAKDRATNALELCWTRGIGPRGYFLAKWAGSFALLSLVAVAAPLFVWTTGVLLAEDWTFLQDTAGLVARALLGHAVFAAVMAWLVLAISAAAGSPNFASIAWLLLVGGSGAISAVLGSLLEHAGWTRLVNLWSDLANFDRWIAGAPLAEGEGPEAAFALLLFAVLLTGLMLRRLRHQEAIT